MQSSPTTANARAFVRSLNVLLKYCNLYGLEHGRSCAQFDATWAELRSTVRGRGDLGLLVGITGSHLLLDGVPLDLSPAELDLAELLALGRVGSIRFMGSATRAEFRRLIEVLIDTDSSTGPLASRVEREFGYHTKARIHTSESLFIQEGVGFYEGGSTTSLESQIAGADSHSKRAQMRPPVRQHHPEKSSARPTKATASQPARAKKFKGTRDTGLSSSAVAVADPGYAIERDAPHARAARSESHQSSSNPSPRESSVNLRSGGYDSRQASKELQAALKKVGEQMAAESDSAMQTKLSAAFTRFSQEAIATKDYESLEQSLDVLAQLEESRPGWAQSLRPRIGVKSSVPEFITTALSAEDVPDGLLGVLARVPDDAGSILGSRLARSARCMERERVVDLARSLGSQCPQHLKEAVRNGGADKAAAAIGLLSRLDPYSVNELLPRRLRDSGRDFHDVIVRQLSIAGARERGHILANSLELFDKMILPLALDEIGMSGDLETAPKLLKLADGGVVKDCSDYLRVKAIEALGRLRAPTAATRLRHFAESRKTLSWEYPEEIRTAAAQALSKFDLAWARQFLPKSGLEASMLALAPLDPKPNRDYVRQRRYKRVHLSRNVPATISTSNANYSSVISILSLDGGLLTGGDIKLENGAEATLKIPAGLRSISMQAVMRFVRPHKAGFEMVGMALDDRVKLRRLIVSLGDAPAATQLRA